METKKIIITSIIISLLSGVMIFGSTSTTIANKPNQPSPCYNNVCEILEEANDYLDNANQQTTKFSFISRFRARRSLLMASHKLSIAQVIIPKCGLSPKIFLDRIVEDFPFFLYEMLDITTDYVSAETLLTIAKASILHAEIELTGFVDHDALNNIKIARILTDRVIQIYCN